MSASKLQPAETEGKTRQAILARLKREGPQDAQALAGHFDVSPMAIRQHLYALREEGLVSYAEVPRPRGRPAKQWRLTEASNALFPDAHASLAVVLIEDIRNAFGQSGMDRLLEGRTARQIKDYRTRIGVDRNPAKSLRQRVKALARIRTEEGYMAEAATAEDGSLLLVENHCPICDAAKTCLGLCKAELTLFEAVLGPEVTVERTEHILSGARRCAYLIRPVNRSTKAPKGT